MTVGMAAPFYKLRGLIQELTAQTFPEHRYTTVKIMKWQQHTQLQGMTGTALIASVGDAKCGLGIKQNNTKHVLCILTSALRLQTPRWRDAAGEH